MQHKIHTFRAATMDEALDLVRRELGQHAVVVDSKEIATRRLLPWPSIRQEIEVNATRTSQKSKAISAKAEATRPVARRVVRTLAEAMSVPVASTPLLAPMPELPVEMAEDERVRVKNLIPQSEQGSTINDSAAGVDGAKIAGVESSILKDQTDLASLQSIISTLQRQSRPRGMNDLPKELYQHYLRLIELDIEDDVAGDLISKVRQQLPAQSMNSSAAIVSMLTALVEREMRCSPPILPRPRRRQIVTLVGPTGVGKTTTLAKLAGHFHLHEGIRVGLITTDTYRVGAIDQLRRYAEILQIPLRTVSNPDELRVAIDGLDDVDLILIDTAGRGPLDNSKLDELRDLTAVAASDHILLVLSIATGAKMLPRIADQFASSKPTSLVLTKLDEAIGCGGLLSVARQVPYPVSYITMGQDVPDQFEPAHPTRLAKLVLGREQLHQESVESLVS